MFQCDMLARQQMVKSTGASSAIANCAQLVRNWGRVSIIDRLRVANVRNWGRVSIIDSAEKAIGYFLSRRAGLFASNRRSLRSARSSSCHWTASPASRSSAAASGSGIFT
jgi:hypothetical protein